MSSVIGVTSMVVIVSLIFYLMSQPELRESEERDPAQRTMAPGTSGAAH